MSYRFQDTGRYLSNEENNTITSILDDEEMQLDAEQNLSILSELDERCRAIWPNWQPSSPPQIRKSPPKRINIEKEPIIPEPRNISPPRPSFNQDPVRQAPPPKPKRFEDPMPQATPISYPKHEVQISKQELDRLDVDELKSDLDALYSKIRGSAVAPSPHHNLFTATPKDFDLPEHPAPEIRSPQRDPVPRVPAFDEFNDSCQTYVSPVRYQYEQRQSPSEIRIEDQFSDLEPQHAAFRSAIDDNSFNISPNRTIGRNQEKSRHVEFVDLTQSPKQSYASMDDEDTREVDKAELESLRRENIRLKAELLKVEKRLELEAEERNKLMRSLEMRKRRQRDESRL